MIPHTRATARRPRRSLAVAALAAALLVAPASADAARQEPCVPGASAPICTVWTTKARSVGDGDTIVARVEGRRRRVRLTGVQAMEQTTYPSDPRKRRGDCHSLAATRRLEQLVRRGRRRVRLAALDPASRAGRRLLRSVAVRIRGRWVDAGEVLLREGHALWLPNRFEWAWNRKYSELAERAAARRLRLWNTRACGRGPSAQARLRLWLEWDAPGDDFDNVNGEWVKIKNLDRSADVPLGGWFIRDSDLPRFRFPAWARIPAGGTVTVYVGPGENAGEAFHWGLSIPTFQNYWDDGTHTGDGAYLFDPHGDLRAWMTYPCHTTCAEGVRGAVDVTAQPRSPESIAVTNTSAGEVDLEGYRIRTPRADDYPFGPGSIIAPGESLVVLTGGAPGSDTRLQKHWGMRRSVLDDSGGSVTLETYGLERIDCYAWGRGSC